MVNHRMRIKAKLEPGKVAVVTGGSSGIGKAIACELAERGMHVWLLAQRKDILESAQKEVERHRKDENQVIGIVSVNVSDLNQVRKTMSFVTEKCGPPDLLVNSAGVTHPGYVETLDIEIFKWMMEVNYFGTVYMIKEVLPAMIKRGSGYILNVCSGSGVASTFGYTAYGASKFAVHGFSEALRMEMKSHGIGVSIVFPSDTDTPQLAYENRFKPPETRAVNSLAGLNKPEDVAKCTIRSIEQGQYFILTNFESKFWYVVVRLFPGLLRYILDTIVDNTIKKENMQDNKKD
jgi:3-dehydrosphinganine reductase